MTALLLDVKHAYRLALRQPLVSAAGLVTLALGLGMTTALFAVAHAWLLTEVPFREPDRLAMVWETLPAADIDENTPAPAALELWRARSRTFESFAAWTTATFTLTGGAEPLRVDAARVSANLLPVLGVQPQLGRNFLPQEDSPGAERVALLSEALWARLFGRQDFAASRSLRLDGQIVQIVGILPSSVRMLGVEADVWVPLAMPAEERESWSRYLWVIGRLRHGSSRGAAQQELEALMHAQSDGKTGANVVDLRAHIVGTLDRDIRILFAAAGCVLLIACLNVAALSLARITGRRAEFAVRTALGASRRRLGRQIFTETAVLGGIAGLTGLLIASWAVRAVLVLLPESERLNEVDVGHGSVFLFALFTALTASGLCAIVPAFQSAGTHLESTIREHGRPTTSRRRPLNALVTLEMAIAFALLVAAGLVLRTYHNLNRVELGFDPASLVTFEIPRPAEETPERTRSFYVQLLEQLDRDPAIMGSALTQALPIRSGCCGSSFLVEGRTGDDGSILAFWRTVSPGYFTVMNIPLIGGRAFTASDGPLVDSVAIVSDSFARRAWPNANAIGKHITWGLERPLTVIGVAGDVRTSLSIPPGPHVYVPFTQLDSQFPSQLVARGRTGTAGIVEAVRRIVWMADPSQPVASIASMDQVIWERLGRRRFQLTLVAVFAAIAAMLALVGIYGVLSFVVGQSAREIGIRLALGATRGSVLGFVLRRGIAILGFAVPLGLLVAAWSGRLVQSILFGVRPWDPVTVAAVITGLVVASLCACILPAYKASRVDPILVLRSE